MKRLILTLFILLTLASPVSAGWLTPVDTWNAQIEVGIFLTVPYRMDGEYNLAVGINYEGPSKKLQLECTMGNIETGRWIIFDNVLPGYDGMQFVFDTIVTDPYQSYLLMCTAADGFISDTAWKVTMARPPD